jgi:hypothetical protein
VSPVDRDKLVPKHPRAATDPAVPRATGYEDVTGQHFKTPEDEEEARFRRDVMRGQRALSIKMAAGARVFRDQLRELVAIAKASEVERERRRAEEIEHKVRRDKFLRFALTKVAPILVAVAGVLTAIAALRSKLP